MTGTNGSCASTRSRLDPGGRRAALTSRAAKSFPGPPTTAWGEPFPEYSAGERRADLCIHLTGVAAGCAGAVVLALVARHGDGRVLLGMGLYAAGLVAMLACSALYNLAAPSPRKRRLRKLDHAAIFVMIAGTYSPFALISMRDAHGTALLVPVWAMAAAGVAWKLARPQGLDRASVVPYLALGWSVLIALDDVAAAVPRSSLILLAVGGVLYSVGSAVHLWRALPYHNPLWHGFVLAAAACHYAAVIGVMP